MLFSALIYTEIIILNFCGLSKNTKKFINERIKEEIKELNEISNDNDVISRDTIEEED